MPHRRTPSLLVSDDYGVWPHELKTSVCSWLSYRDISGPKITHVNVSAKKSYNILISPILFSEKGNGHSTDSSRISVSMDTPGNYSNNNKGNNKSNSDAGSTGKKKKGYWYNVSTPFIMLYLLLLHQTVNILTLVRSSVTSRFWLRASWFLANLPGWTSWNFGGIFLYVIQL